MVTRCNRNKQSKKMSAIETSVNLMIGFCLAILIQRIVFPWFNIETHYLDNMIIAAIFTSISFVRGYIVRRIFENIGH